MKRILDIIFSGVFFIILSPLFILIPIAIKINSQGPIFFSQKRVGKDGKIFLMYKFRSMYINTPPNIPTHLLKSPQKCITFIGEFLRKSSLDELPQLVNVLLGDMSFVGPRPALFNQYDLINIRYINGVNSISPGITGWAQVNGRDEISIEEKAKYDKFYLDNKSIFFDLKIILITIIRVLSARGLKEGNQNVFKTGKKQ